MTKKIITMKTLSVAVAVGTAMLAGTAVHAEETQWAGFVENATYYRDGVGLSKFRNTGQAEFLKPIETSGRWYDVTLNGVLRATYDGVYDLNDDEFGEDSREAYLGANWHGQDTSTHILAPGISVPCENNPALCSNLDDYMDQDKDEIRYPDFNDELDFVREFYLDATTDLSNGDQLSLRVGKQQVVWGRTDLFRVLDVINPVDYSRHNIYDELEDIRIPQWMLQAEWRMGPVGNFDDMNLAVVWNFDQFRPSNLGTCGQAYRILDAGCFFSSYIPAGGPIPAVIDTDGDGSPDALPVIGDVQDVDWDLSNTQLGMKWEGVYGDATFSVNALTYRQQLPSLHPSVNPAVFDIHFPRVNLIGGSMDYYHQGTDSTWRIETALTEGEELPRDTNGHKETNMLRYVVGFDKNMMIPALNDKRAFLISTQVFGQHVLDHEADMPDAKDNWIGTLLFKGWWNNDRVSPQIIIAHDVEAQATVFAPSIEWLPDDHWKLTLGASIKTGGDETFPWSVASGAGDTSGQFEPLARFSNGPIGVANEEDEIQMTIRYAF